MRDAGDPSDPRPKTRLGSADYCRIGEALDSSALRALQLQQWHPETDEVERMLMALKGLKIEKRSMNLGDGDTDTIRSIFWSRIEAEGFGGKHVGVYLKMSTVGFYYSSPR